MFLTYTAEICVSVPVIIFVIHSVLSRDQGCRENHMARLDRPSGPLGISLVGRRPPFLADWLMGQVDVHTEVN